MGGACCVAARDRTLSNGPCSEGVHRNYPCSPLWSVKWDNRGRVAGEDSSHSWLSDGISRNDASDIKSRTDVSAHASDRGSPLENHRMGIWRKGTVNDENVQRTKTSASGQFIYTNFSTQVNASTESPLVSGPASLKSSPSVLSLPSVATSPFSSQSHMLPPNSTPSRGAHYTPGNRLTSQESEMLSSGRTSPFIDPISEERWPSYVQHTGSDESTRRSQGRSSDGWSLNAFSELLPSSHRERDRWSFGSQSYSFTHDNKSIGSIGHSSRSVSFDLQTCGVCSKALTDRAAYSSDKIFANSELAAVAVLICGHVYHAECLETVTPEISKYDPDCPICTFGKKQVRRLTGKALKAEKEMNSRSSKKSRNRLSTTDDGSFEFDYWKSSPSTYEGKDQKLMSSPSLKDYSGKPFIRRHFSFGLKGSKSNPDSHTMIKKAPFWAKSSKQ